MILFQIDSDFGTVSVTWRNVYNQILRITGDEALAIECQSWAELATVGETYDESTFSIECIETSRF